MANDKKKPPPIKQPPVRPSKEYPDENRPR